MMDGVLSTSSGVNDHWFAPGKGVCDPDGAGVCWVDAAWERGGELRDDAGGGVGAAGGTSRRAVGDRVSCCSCGGGFPTVGGWYPSRGGRYRSMLAILMCWVSEVRRIEDPAFAFFCLSR